MTQARITRTEIRINEVGIVGILIARSNTMQVA
jgi:hypothetical protein